MRTRWKIDPLFVILVFFAAWFAWIVVASETWPAPATPPAWVMLLLLSPFEAALGALIVAGVVAAWKYFQDNPPLQRIREPIVQDLREEYTPEKEEAPA